MNDRLRLLRERMGLSQTAAAKKMGIVRTTYSNYEAGNREPDVDTIKKMSDFFGVSTDYLLGNNDESQIKESRAGYLSDDQVLEAAEIFSHLSKEERANLLDFMRRMPKKNK